ncbi:MAG TPA: hypothetical protein VF691_13525, partial [Cytophagaceae bacterium]
PEYINILNPALITNKRQGSLDSTIKYMIFETALTAQFRSLNSNELNSKSGGGNFSYFAFLFPISKRWSTSVGLRPYTNVKNNYSSQSTIGSGITNYNENNYGGISQVYLANGLDISNSLSVGLHVGYLFGKINRESLTQPYIPAVADFLSQTGQNLNTSYSGFEIRPGIQYRKALIKDTSETGHGLFLSIGAAASFTNLRAIEQLKYISKTANDAVYIDTLLPPIYWKYDLPATYSSIKLPNSYSFGISLDDPSKWAAEIDFTYSPWSGYSGGDATTRYVNSYTVNVGGEYKLGNEENIKRKELRAGFAYSKLPYSLRGEQISDVNFTLGTTLPFGRKDARFKSKPLTKINLALIAGQRGTAANGLVKENYIKFYAGILINDRWFQKRRID